MIPYFPGMTPETARVAKAVAEAQRALKPSAPAADTRSTLQQLHTCLTCDVDWYASEAVPLPCWVCGEHGILTRNADDKAIHQMACSSTWTAAPQD